MFDRVQFIENAVETLFEILEGMAAYDLSICLGCSLPLRSIRR